MAFATEMPIGTGSKMSANFQSQDFNVSLTYQLERGDIDLVQLAEEKAAEVETLHARIRRQILQLRSQAAPKPAAESNAQDRVQSTDGSMNGSVQEPTTMTPEIASKTRSEAPITKAQQRVIQKLVERAEMTCEELETLVACRFGWSRMEKLTQRQGHTLIAELQRRIQRNQQKSNDHSAT